MTNNIIRLKLNLKSMASRTRLDRDGLGIEMRGEQDQKRKILLREAKYHLSRALFLLIDLGKD